MRIGFTLLYLAVFSLHAQNGLQEQTPLPMMAPKSSKEHHSLWLPITLEPNAAHTAHTPSKTLDESIQKQIKKKMEAILKPMAEDSDQ